MAVPNGSIDIWNFVDNVTGTTVRKWLRDSWARRKIVALQQAIAGIVVPTASTANPQMDGTAAPGVSTDYARADHIHPHDTSKADAATTYTKSQIDAMIPSVPSASTSNPTMDGTASPGSSTAWARGDHVHPHDTSKADKATTLAGYGITNAYTKTEVDGMIPTVPTNVSAFANDAGYLTSAPVTSVNSQTGAVNLTASDVGALPSSTAIPVASGTSPLMDGTAAVGSSADYARADHMHPSDTSKQDALTSSQMDAVNSGITAEFVTGKFAVVTGTLPTSATWGAYSNYPNGFTYTNCVMLSFEVYRAAAGDWRQGEGSITNSFSRLYCAMDANGIRAMTNNSSTYGADYRVVLMRTDI